MALSRSLSTGASSLRAHQQRFDVISNNIANVNTTGYKSNHVNFAEQFNQIYKYGSSPNENEGKGMGGVNPLMMGLGVKIGSITQNMAQGTIETTNRPLDLALQGNGFFIYNMNGKQLFSRAGAISRDKNGNLVDSSSGAFLMGYNLQLDADGKMVKDSNGDNVLNRTLKNINISPNIISAPRQTEVVKVAGNLNSASTENTERQTSITIFDNQGGAHVITLTFTKTANPNEFTMSAKLDGIDITLPSDTLTFNTDGTISSPLDFTLNAADLNTALGTDVFDATTPKNVKIVLAETGNLLAGLTQFAGPNTATVTEQDGYQAGDLNELFVDTTGKIWGSFTNGQSEILAQVAVAKFTNPQGLIRNGNNFMEVSPNSGLPNIGTAGEIFPSTLVVGGALEQSNVDLTEQFTEMIITQRAFEAASRTITISDQMLAETNMLKR